jgi:hypothetical protein
VALNEYVKRLNEGAAAAAAAATRIPFAGSASYNGDSPGAPPGNPGDISSDSGSGKAVSGGGDLYHLGPAGPAAVSPRGGRRASAVPRRCSSQQHGAAASDALSDAESLPGDWSVSSATTAAASALSTPAASPLALQQQRPAAQRSSTATAQQTLLRQQSNGRR